MKIKAILFDLDGTLLPMDQDKFINGYLSLLAKKGASRGYDSKELISAVWKGTSAMIKNDGSDCGEAVFWRVFAEIYGDKAEEDKPMFDEFYQNEFDEAKMFCAYNPESARVVRELRNMGYRTVLATNPVFPRIATEKRMSWAGLSPSDFELCTTYENIGYCKPNPKYYAHIAMALGLSPEECLMVGNDTGDDMSAQAAGMSVFLLTDCLINKDDDITKYPHGGFDELMEYIKSVKL